MFLQYNSEKNVKELQINFHVVYYVKVIKKYLSMTTANMQRSLWTIASEFIFSPPMVGKITKIRRAYCNISYQDLVGNMQIA